VYAYVVDELAIPDWLREAVLYEVFVDRFAPDPGRSFVATDDLSAFHGGTLRGILDRLPYLVDLGVTCLWLTPITTSPSHHGYDPVDLRSVEPRLGREQDLRELTSAAHEAGLRVVLDFVANHVSSQHPAFLAAQADPASQYHDWFFFRRWPHDYESYYDVPELPIVDTDVPAVRDERIEAARHWLRLGCDGFRLDHAHGATHAFWSRFRAGIREADPQAVTFGEITDTPARVRSYAGRMDGALDFQLLELLRGFFASGTLTASQLEQGLRAHEAYVGDALVLPSFLDNHDTNRFLWTVGDDVRRLKLAALCQFTLPGPPIVYYGTEVGLSQRRGLGRLEEARLPMPWDERQDRALLRFYRDLIAMRRATGWRAWAEREPLLVDDEGGLLAYRCREHVVVLNNAEAAVDVELPPGDLVLATDAGVASRTTSVHLPARSGAVRRLGEALSRG
jgi:glycosidase